MLATLCRKGYAVPPALAISVKAYRYFLRQTELNARIVMELGQKDFSQMRWEEIWDASLRIRNLFLKTPMSPDTGPLGGRIPERMHHHGPWGETVRGNSTTTPFSRTIPLNSLNFL